MIVLHAAADNGQLLLWGESPPEPVASVRRSAKAGTKSLALLPFDAEADRLTAALAEAVPGLKVPAKDVEEWVAWLPTTDQGPVASSSLVAEPPPAGARLRLAPWMVSAVVVPADRVADLLASSLGQTTLAPGVIVGKTLAFWAEAFRLAAALVARQQFLPGIVAVGETFRARWEPVLTGADAPRLAQLARAMPSACRALTRPAAPPPEVAAAEVLSAFLTTTVDLLARPPAAPEPAQKGKARVRDKAPTFASLHDQWVRALSAPDSRLTGDLTELARLADQVRQWRRPVDVAAAGPFRLCFRLEEPDADVSLGPRGAVRGKDDWYIRYLLQAADDPSLLVPVADAWDPRGRKAEILNRGGFRSREYLLATLGQASALSSGIEESLKAARPAGFTTDAYGAQTFLAETSFLLEGAGFGVLLPAWWSRKGTKLRLAARAVVKSPKMTSKSKLSLDTILRFRWEVALGGERLTLKELRALAQLKSPLVKIRGQWVQLNVEEIQAALDFWKTKGDSPLPAREAVRMALGLAAPPAGLNFDGVQATGWMADLLDQLQGSKGFEALPAPAGFQGTLRPYQERGFSWLAFLRRWGLGACLADDMGLGKTVQTLALIQRDWEANSNGERRPTLLICPMSVVGNWQKEAARFAPDLPVMVHHGQTRIKGPAFQKQASQQALVLSSYSLLHRDFTLFQKVPWGNVVLDEAQNIKNPQTRQSQSARGLEAAGRIALTGTPVENHVGDLWSIMEFLNPGLLGTQAEFKRTFHVPIQVQHDPEAARRLQRLTGPFILRRLKTDKSIIADLPDKLEMKVFCNLTKEQTSLYEAVVADTIEQIETSEGIQRKGLVLATLSKLKQVCNHPAHFLGDNSPIPDRSGKLARLTEMLEEALSAGDRALIFSQFAEMGDILRRHLQETFGREVLFLHGGVPKTRRDQMVERFQSGTTDAPPLFVLSVKAGGTGLNLTAANHVFHFDRWWNPAVENQATDRAFRIGQLRNVQVHKFLCVGTLEEKIDEMIESKQKVAGLVVGSGEDWLTKLSTAELRDLFALRNEALGE